MRTVLRRVGKAVWWTATLQLPRRVRERRAAMLEAASAGGDVEAYGEWIRRYDAVAATDLDEMAASLSYRPTFSIAMAVCDPPLEYLHLAIDSVRDQAYDRWELCIADDASTGREVAALLDRASRADERVRVTRLPVRSGISYALNSALELATGEFVGFLDHDDVLRRHALLLVADELQRNRDALLVYSDEDKIDHEGTRSEPYFKPDWNPALLLGQNYLAHFLVSRTDAVRAAGGFRASYDGAQDWDLVLRLTGQAPAGAVRHVPHVLYHWRKHSGSSAEGAAAKPYASPAGRRAVEDHLRASGRDASVETVAFGLHRIRYAAPAQPPSVDLVLPTALSHGIVPRSLEGILRRTRYRERTVYVAIDQEDYEARADAEFRRLLDEPAVKLVLHGVRPFRFPEVVNAAVERGSSDLVCLVNDDVVPIDPDWLEAMVSRVIEPGVGAVGAMLYYPTNTVQHAGVVLGLGNGHVAGHYHVDWERGNPGYFGRAAVDQDMSAVTAACAVVRRSVFEKLGGFDEALPVAFNDVDLCLRMRAAGWRIVWTPCAELYHHESSSLGRHDSGRRSADFERAAALMRERWGERLLSDPNYNVNLSLRVQNGLSFPPRGRYPWQ